MTRFGRCNGVRREGSQGARHRDLVSAIQSTRLGLGLRGKSSPDVGT